MATVQELHEYCNLSAYGIKLRKLIDAQPITGVTRSPMYGRAHNGRIMLAYIDKAIAKHRAMAEYPSLDRHGFRRHAIAQTLRYCIEFAEEFYRQERRIFSDAVKQCDPDWPEPKSWKHVNHLDAIAEEAAVHRRLFEEQISDRLTHCYPSLVRLAKLCKLYDTFYHHPPEKRVDKNKGSTTMPEPTRLYKAHIISTPTSRPDVIIGHFGTSTPLKAAERAVAEGWRDLRANDSPEMPEGRYEVAITDPEDGNVTRWTVLREDNGQGYDHTASLNAPEITPPVPESVATGRDSPDRTPRGFEYNIFITASPTGDYSKNHPFDVKATNAEQAIRALFAAHDRINTSPGLFSLRLEAGGMASYWNAMNEPSAGQLTIDRCKDPYPHNNVPVEYSGNALNEQPEKEYLIYFRRINGGPGDTSGCETMRGPNAVQSLSRLFSRESNRLLGIFTAQVVPDEDTYYVANSSDATLVFRDYSADNPAQTINGQPSDEQLAEIPGSMPDIMRNMQAYPPGAWQGKDQARDSRHPGIIDPLEYSSSFDMPAQRFDRDIPTQEFPTGAVRGTDKAGVRYDLIPNVGLRRLAETCAEGERKYGAGNWIKGFPTTDLINHAVAHLNSYQEGDESEDHLAHAAWNLFVAMHNSERRPELHTNPHRAAMIAERTKTETVQP